MLLLLASPQLDLSLKLLLFCLDLDYVALELLSLDELLLELLL
jgi:hypothetical protein